MRSAKLPTAGSPRARPARVAAGCIALSAVFAACSLAIAAEADTEGAPSRADEIAALREWRETTGRLQAAIDTEQSANGPRSRALIELYMTLGLTQQEHGEQDRAVDAFTHALEVKRANDGLYNLEQAPIIGRMQASEAARGNVEAAGELENTLLRLALANPLDSRSVSIWRDHGDRQLAAYERYRAGERAPPALTVHFGGQFGGDGGFAVSPEGPGLLAMARGSYNAAIGVILRMGDVADEALPEIEHDLIETFYLELERIRAGAFIEPAGVFAGGDRSYRRLAAYIGLNGGTVLEAARAIVDRADWWLLFSRNGEALEQYDEAYRMLKEARAPDAAIRELFPTDHPVLLPAFTPSPFEPREESAGADYVDLAFEVSKYGVGRKVRVTGASAAGEKIEKDAVSIVARNRFRPQPPASGASEPIYRVRYRAAP